MAPTLTTTTGGEGMLAGSERPSRVFLAAPFSQFLDPHTGTVGAAVRTSIDALRRALEAEGHSVFLAHERESWGAALMPPEECTPLDFAEMHAADIVCAHLGSPPSHGVHIELGWASALGKPIVLLLSPGQTHSPLVYGLETVTAVTRLHLDDRPLADAVPEIVSAVAALLPRGAFMLTSEGTR
jgi:nucleoside 2-deoxyribosyltransferase